MKKSILLVLVVIILTVFCACGGTEPISTKIGAFQYEQVFTKALGEETAADGNIYLVVYLTPADGTEVSMDEAQKYFLNGSKATLAEQTYEIKYLAFEQVDKKYIRFGLVFEITDNNYEEKSNQPVVSLILP